MLDVGIAIDFLGVSITRIRNAPGSYVDGKWIPGPPTSTAVTAVVQPIIGGAINSTFGHQLMDLPEGVRTEAKLAAWSRSDFALDDTVVYKGQNYRVLFVWDRQDGGFYRALLGLLR